MTRLVLIALVLVVLVVALLSRHFALTRPFADEDRVATIRALDDGGAILQAVARDQDVLERIDAAAKLRWRVAIPCALDRRALRVTGNSIFVRYACETDDWLAAFDLEGHRKWVHLLAAHPSGREMFSWRPFRLIGNALVAEASWAEETLRVFDARSGWPLYQMNNIGKTSLALWKDGPRIVSDGIDGLRTLDVRSWEEHALPRAHACAAGDTFLVASTSAARIELWSIPHLEPARAHVLASIKPEGSESLVGCTALGTHVVVVFEDYLGSPTAFSRVVGIAANGEIAFDRRLTGLVDRSIGTSFEQHDAMFPRTGSPFVPMWIAGEGGDEYVAMLNLDTGAIRPMSRGLRSLWTYRRAGIWYLFGFDEREGECLLVVDAQTGELLSATVSQERAFDPDAIDGDHLWWNVEVARPISLDARSLAPTGLRAHFYAALHPYDVPRRLSPAQRAVLGLPAV